jgi:hypothetical protein
MPQLVYLQGSLIVRAVIPSSIHAFYYCARFIPPNKGPIKQDCSERLNHHRVIITLRRVPEEANDVDNFPLEIDTEITGYPTHRY